MIKSLFKPNKSLVGNIYVVDGGTYGGDYLVLMEENALNYTFLILPDKKKRIVTREDFKRGLDNRVVKFLEKLPSFVFKECKKEYDLINKDIWTSSDQFKSQAQ
jgi:hypothetical protein